MSNNFNSLFGFPGNQQPPAGLMSQQQGQGGMGGPDASMDRAQRSVFVGNIPYDATEEQLRDVFEQAGPVKSFRLVYDRESGKPKGYGFCEYQDIETAQSAMRNLNNVDFNGRPLRVGVAAGEQTKDDSKSMQQALGAQALESPYGEPVEPEKAPEAISKAVASLPPEQMFELMKQMKLCIQNNPNEARNMLLQNPQLAYALLQAQIVMKIVDPQVAMAMLYRDETQPKMNVKPGPGPVRAPQPPTMVQPPMPPPAMKSQPLQQPPRPQVDIGNLNQFSNRPQNIAGPPQPVPRPGGPGPSSSSIAPVPRPPVPPIASTGAQPSSGGPPSQAGANVTSQDQEKAALIMQVLQLTDEQIAVLPPEQRQSILILKEQIKSG